MGKSKLIELAKELESVKPKLGKHKTIRDRLIREAEAVISDYDWLDNPASFAVDFALDQFGEWVQMIEIAGIVNNLNMDIYSRTGSTDNLFSFSTNGMAFLILFDECEMWSSETDEREYNSKTGEPEDLRLHIMEKFNEWATRNTEFQFNVSRELIEGFGDV